MASTIKDLMTEIVITIRPDTPLAEAVNILTQHNFNGLPVVDEKNVLVGLLTERDLILNDSYLHLKTLLKLMNEFNFYKKDAGDIKEDLKKVMDMKVSDVMNQRPLVLHPDDNIEAATRLFGDPKVNPIPIVDSNNKLLGVMSLSDLTKLYGVTLREDHQFKEVDKNIDLFLKEFEKKFILVSKFRTNTWMVTSIIFAIAGFIIAFMLIIRISV